MSSSVSKSPTPPSSSSSRSKALSQHGKDLLQRATSGPSALLMGHTDILSKLSFSAVSTKSKEAKMWTEEEDNLLRRAIEKYGEDWAEVVKEVPGRNKLQCVQRWKKTLRPGLTKGPWKPEEDALLLEVMREEMEGDWQAIARRIPGRNAKQCKERWTLNLNPEINHGPWSPEEDAALVQLHSEIGGKWSVLAKRLSGRTEHSIKTRFLSLQRQAAKVRGWTVDEDRTVLKQFMLADDLDGSASAIKALKGRTKKQVVQRWQYLREQFVSIDDLATANPGGNVALTDQDLRMLVPHPSLTQGEGDPLAQMFLPPLPGGSLPSPAAKAAANKSLARRHGSSSVSQQYRHVAKKLEKSGSSSSSSTRMPGMDLIHAAYAPGYASSSNMYNNSGSLTPIMAAASASANNHGGNGGSDPFVAGLEKGMLEMSTADQHHQHHQQREAGISVPSLIYMQSKYGSSTSSSNGGSGTGGSGATGSDQLISPFESSSRQFSTGSTASKKGLGNFPLSSSFRLNPSSYASSEMNHSTGVSSTSNGSTKSLQKRADSFLVLADELEQIAQQQQQQQRQQQQHTSTLRPQLSQQYSSSFIDLPMFPSGPAGDGEHVLRPAFSSSFISGVESSALAQAANNNNMQRAPSFSTVAANQQLPSRPQQSQPDYPIAMFRPGADPNAFIIHNEYFPASFSPTPFAAPSQPAAGLAYFQPPPLDHSLSSSWLGGQVPSTSDGGERRTLRQFASSLTGPGTGSTVNMENSFDLDQLDINMFPTEQ